MNIINQLESLTTVDWIIICTIVVAYLPLMWAIHNDKKDGAGQNFYTWILWLVLDIAQITSTIMAHGTYVMFLAFIPCCAFTTVLVSKHRKPINSFEWAAVILVIICIPIWIVLGSIWAIIIQTFAQTVAGVPNLVNTWQKPSKFKKTLFPLFIFLIAHAISFYRKTGLAVEDTLFAGVMFVFTFASMLPLLIIPIRRWWKRYIFPWR